MFRRIAPAVLLLGLLGVSANAQKDTPKPTKPIGGLTWETVAADKASKLATKRAQVPGGWLVVVQTGDDMSLTFFPDPGHRWSDDASPSDVKPGKPQSDDLTKAAADKLKVDLEQARAAALGERDKAVAIQKKLEEELKRLQAELERTKKTKKPKKSEKGDRTSDANTAAERQRIAEALGLAAREESQKAESIVEQARAAAASALEDNQRLKAELELAKKEAERLRQLLEKKKK